MYAPSELDAIRTRLSESELKEVYRDPIKKIGLKPVNLLLKQNPIEFWTEKRLIDPTTLDLFLPTKLKDIDKILAQNYFICFDNFYEITREFSDMICAAITGSGTQVRELFTTQTMITLPIKACIAFSSVTRLFTQSDAVSRLLSYEFLPFAEEEGYSTEDEINDRFEEIRPQILACMYHTMSKAINIRNRIHRKSSLGRMADVLEWGEAYLKP